MKVRQSQDTMVVLWGAGVPFAIAICCITIGMGGTIAIIARGSIELLGLASVSFVLALMGVVILAFLKNRKTVLSKTAMSTYTEKRVVGGKQTTQNFNTDQVESVRLFIALPSNGGQIELQSTLLLVMKDTSTLQIGFASKNASTNILTSGPKDLSKTPLYSDSLKIAEFLGVPLEVPGIS